MLETEQTTGDAFLDPAIDRTEIRPFEAHATEELLSWYRSMKLARTFEQKLAALYRQGKIVGAVYLGMGQEAIATGVVSLLEKDDYFSTVARGLAGWFHARRRSQARAGALVRQGHSARRTAASSACFSPISRLRHRAVSQRIDGVVDSLGRGLRAGLQVPPRAACLCGDDRRRRHQPGRLLRGAELRRHPQAAAGRHRREQLLRLLDPDEPADAGGQRRRSRAGVQHSGGDRLRQRHLRGPPAGDARRSITPAAAGARISSSSRPSDSAATASTTTWRYVPRESARVLGAPRSDPAASRSISSATGGDRRHGALTASIASAVRVIEEAVHWARRSRIPARSVHRTTVQADAE